MKNNPLLMTDGYKTSHLKMYPKGTSLVYSNYTCRNTKRMPAEAQDVVVFGIQYMIKYIQELFQNDFFLEDKSKVCNEAKEYLSSYLGTDYDVSHFEALHDLGYLPIEIKALDEGTVVNAGIPLFTIKNTLPEFFWVTNYLETLLSTLIWKPVHSASLALAYKKVLTRYCLETDKDNIGFVDFQGHDFSFRGMQSPESAMSSSMGFLTSFKGTDTVPALLAMKHYYNSSNVGFSVPASEHSVMCAHGKEDEINTLTYLMQQYPTGVLSVVSDTWDLWKLLTEYLPELKEEILTRDGKLVIRSDSGDPVDIICGTMLPSDPDFLARKNSSEEIGVIELLWDIFGGTINKQGYKVLDSHIGAIYGDSITLERAGQICARLKAKGFASTNIVLGIGSYALGYSTRDNQGGAIKSTYVEVTSQKMDARGYVDCREIFKDPITDDGTKKSAKGLLRVTENLKLVDQQTWAGEATGLLKTVFLNGEATNIQSLDQIREKLNLRINAQ